MSKRTLIILIGIVILALVILVGVYVFFIQKEGRDGILPLREFFPTGSGIRDIETGSGIQANGEDDSLFGADGNVRALLTKLSDSAVAGSVALEREGDTYVRFIERATGHVYETTPTKTQFTRITNTTIPKIQIAFWFPDGESVLARYEGGDSKTIESFYGNTIATPEGTLSGIFLPRNITTFSLSPDGTSIFYILSGPSDGMGIMSDPDGENAQTIFETGISRWNIEWPEEKTIALTTKPSFSTLGYLYFLNTQTKRLNKILGRIVGLTTLTNPTLDTVLYSESTRGTFVSKRVNIDTREQIELQLRTLPEKCVWSKKNTSHVYCGVPNSIPNGEYPDVWYQGSISFTDSLWLINVESGTTTLLLNLEKEGQDIDVIKPLLTPKEDYLLFVNKKDSVLWSLALRENSKAETASSSAPLSDSE